MTNLYTKNFQIRKLKDALVYIFNEDTIFTKSNLRATVLKLQDEILFEVSIISCIAKNE